MGRPSAHPRRLHKVSRRRLRAALSPSRGPCFHPANSPGFSSRTCSAGPKPPSRRAGRGEKSAGRDGRGLFSHPLFGHTKGFLPSYIRRTGTTGKSQTHPRHADHPNPTPRPPTAPLLPPAGRRTPRTHPPRTRAHAPSAGRTPRLTESGEGRGAPTRRHGRQRPQTVSPP